MLDERVRDVLARLEAEDERESAAGLPPAERSLAVGPEAGRLLFALVAPNPGCDVLEIGGSRGYSTLWLASAARILGGRVVSLEADPAKCDAWRRNIADAGLDEHAELVQGDALQLLPSLDEGFDLVLLDAWKRDYEELFERAREKVDPGGVLVADNVVSHGDELAEWVARRQGDPTLVSVTVPVGHGLEVSTVLARPGTG
jgi:predicted O-methyltransferase YrrM